jgi:hydrogenase-4 component F
MGFAAVFMVRQPDFKRMLAYSSVEHRGILVLGVGIGGLATFGALLHLINNAMTKGVLFLSAGNIHRAYDSKSSDEVRGAIRRLPLSGSLFLAGFLAIAGSPPGGPFLSEFTIVSGAVTAGHFVVSGLFLIFLATIFVGMGATVLTIVQGNPSERASATDYRDSLWTGLPIVLFMGLVLLLGLYIPPPLESLLREAVQFLEARP